MIKMAGYDLSADRSGESSDRATPVISKQGQSGSSVCFVSGGSDCFCEESGLSDLLCKEAAGQRARERDSHEDKGEASGQAFGYCLDADEEEGEFDPSYLNLE